MTGEHRFDLSEVPEPDRRHFLKTGILSLLGGAAVLTGAPCPLRAAGFAVPDAEPFRIGFRNQHTGESFTGAYRVGDKYLPEAFEQINHALRDFRTGDIHPIDPRVLDVLFLVHEQTGSNRPFEILSGYRSPKTNAMLRRNGTGVAKDSLHMQGKAIDLRLPGYSTRKVRNIAKDLRAGGVGYYEGSNFVHIDTGRVRHW